MGIIIPNIWKNKTCSKPPTSYTYAYIYMYTCMCMYKYSITTYIYIYIYIYVHYVYWLMLWKLPLRTIICWYRKYTFCWIKAFNAKSPWHRVTFSTSVSFKYFSIHSWGAHGFQPFLVGGFNPTGKYERHLGLLFPIYGKTCSKPPTSFPYLVTSS